MVGVPCPGTSQLPTEEGRGQTRACLRRRENQIWLRRGAHSNSRKECGDKPWE